MFIMRLLSLIVPLIGLSVFGQDKKNDIYSLLESLPEWSIKALEEIPSKNYKIIANMNPLILEADFNGDSLKDIVIPIVQLGTEKMGIVIIHQVSNEYFVLGAGSTFGNVGDDFKWTQDWKVQDINVQQLSHDKDDKMNNLNKSKSAIVYVTRKRKQCCMIFWNGIKYDWTQFKE
jgi:hypothetical protein